MKLIIPTILIILMLCGCGADIMTYETICDEWDVPVMASPREIFVRLPGEADLSPVDGENGRIYLTDEYEITIETLDSGDLNATLQSVCGYEESELTLVKTQPEGLKRYDFVWASAGEHGNRIGRGVILDDGSYHYVMTVMRDAECKQSVQIVWSDVFQSFSLV